MGERVGVAFIRLEKAEKARHCCLLAERFFLEGRRVLIVVEDREQGAQLDKYLWTWRKLSFIPHGLVEEGADDGHEPVLIASECRATFGAEVLIMVHPCPVEFIHKFSSAFDFAEIYDPKLQEKSRRRFALYRDAGLDPYLHQ